MAFIRTKNEIINTCYNPVRYITVTANNCEYVFYFHSDFSVFSTIHFKTFACYINRNADPGF